MKIFYFILMLLCLLLECDFRKNVVLIVVDDLRPALGSYKDKNAYTPNIDLLAEKSIQFNHAYSQQALCAPSRNSFLTSRRPDSLYLYDVNSYWRVAAGNFTTLPQYFKEHGYTTASFGKVFHPGASSNWSDDSPYSWSVPPFHPPTEVYKDSPVCMNEDGTFSRNLVCPVEPSLQPGGGTLPDMETLQAAQNFLLNSNRSVGNFFLAIGFHKPHIPLKYPFKYLKFHPLSNMSVPKPKRHPPTLPDVAWNPWTDVRTREDIVALNLSFPYAPIPDYFTQIIRQNYYAAVTYIDDLIGQLISTLKINNYMDNTIIALIGDHGWSLGEHQEWAKYSNYEVALRVPFILYIPGLTTSKKKLNNNDIAYKNSQKVSNNLVELVDLFPTLCDLSDLPPPPLCDPTPSSQPLCTEGASLIPLLHNSEFQWKTAAFSQYPRPSHTPTTNSDRPKLKDITIMGYSVRTKHFRYTEWVSFRDLTAHWNEVIAEEMYDYRIDKAESLNLAGRAELQGIQNKLRRLLRAGWRTSGPHNF